MDLAVMIDTVPVIGRRGLSALRRPAPTAPAPADPSGPAATAEVGPDATESVRSARAPAAAPSPGAARWSSPDLSVILVSWNTRDELRACLESVVAGVQDISAELVVVDNASSDGSADMVQARFPNVRLVRNPENLGFAAGCNAGLEVATGRYLLLLNPDTIVLDDVLAATVRYLDEHPGVGAVGCRVLTPTAACSARASVTRRPEHLPQCDRAGEAAVAAFPRA